ncbi:MAG: T9SS type A sorting domain-containing protein [Flavobacteriales bacterium]|nr:T9SS type A sorting domain-containing protein [Flavobacteriales bacterium]MCX7768927.1 T9SS type A sorting domain-containing protein [Flavobacteriales bacterium]MDW8409968.1 T9SS type A sorting domain-containing protein [Flavobacteriales bacterium]
MKSFYLALSFAAISIGSLIAQANLILSDGTGTLRFRLTGTNPYLVLNNANFINNASSLAFDPGAANANSGIVLVTGNSDTQIGGSAPTTFSNLRINKSNAEVDLNQNITVTYRASLIASMNNRMDLNNSQMTLGPNAIITGENITTTGGARFYCDDNELGTIRKDTSFAGPPSGQYVGNLGVQIWANANLGPTTSIIRGHDRQTSTVPGGGTSIGRFFDIIPGGVWNGINGGIGMFYHQDELYTIPEGNLVFYRSPSYGVNTSDWEEYGYGSYAGAYAGLGIWAINNSTTNHVLLNYSGLGLGFHSFSRWTLSDPDVSPLPVSLTSLTATCNNDHILITWTTASELNSKEFVVQRSTDLQNWVFVGAKPGAGNSNQPLSYSLVDPRPEPGVNYYRLLQFDYNNSDPAIYGPVSSSCSPTGEPTGENLVFYPNPSTDWMTVDVVLAEAWDNAELRIMDVTGKLVQLQNVSLKEGFNSFKVDVSNLAPATYAFVLSNGVRSFPIQKFVVHR